MVTVYLRGGLGNQMFQYAAGLSMAKKNNTKLLIDAVYLSDRTPRPNFTYRDYDLDIFTLQPRYTKLSKMSQVFPLPLFWLVLDMGATITAHLLGLQRYISEKSETFDPKIFQSTGNMFLFGRWQSEKYFKEIADEVKAAFQFRIPLNIEAVRMKEKINSTNSVSLHVRRGDYATHKNVLQMMGQTNVKYYQNAIEYISQKIDAPNFFVFSDDIEWCKENIVIKNGSCEYVSDACAGPKASNHLELMSLCKHNIIANSTFSWWGAWLNKNPDKIVVAPKNWYNNKKNDRDIIPDTWIKL